MTSAPIDEEEGSNHFTSTSDKFTRFLLIVAYLAILHFLPSNPPGFQNLEKGFGNARNFNFKAPVTGKLLSVYNMNQILRQCGQERHGAGIDQAAKHPPPPLDKKPGKKRGGVEKG